MTRIEWLEAQVAKSEEEAIRGMVCGLAVLALAGAGMFWTLHAAAHGMAEPIELFKPVFILSFVSLGIGFFTFTGGLFDEQLCYRYWLAELQKERKLQTT